MVGQFGAAHRFDGEEDVAVERDALGPEELVPEGGRLPVDLAVPLQLRALESRNVRPQDGRCGQELRLRVGQFEAVVDTELQAEGRDGWRQPQHELLLVHWAHGLVTLRREGGGRGRAGWGVA